MSNKASTFLYKNTIDLTVLEGEKINFPMFNNHINLFKGVTNTVDFTLKNTDRKSVKITGGSIKLYMFDEETDEVLFYKYAIIDDEVKGKYKVIIESGDIENSKPGLYRFSVVYTNFEEVDQMLYTDFSQNAIGTFQIVDRAFPKFIPALEIGNSDFKIQDTNTFTTGRYIGDAQNNIQDGLNTLALYLTNFTGNFIIEASLEDYPTSDDQFATIQSITYEEETGLKDIYFEGSYVWIRFKYVTDESNTGSVDKLLYKN